MINIMLILLILLVVAFALYTFVRRAVNVTDDNEGIDDIKTVESLGELVSNTFDEANRRNVNDMNLSSTQYRREVRNKEERMNALHTAAYGDATAKSLIKSFISDILTDPKIGGIDRENIESIIPFSDSAHLKSRYRFEILIYLWLSDPEGNGQTSYFFHKYGWDKPKKTRYGDFYDITEDDVETTYNLYMKERGGMKYQEKIGFLSQYIYESRYGLGAADLLLETNVDEVQGGTSGIAAGSFDIKANPVQPDDTMSEYEKNLLKPRYSYESVWIIFHGMNTRVSATTFGTQKELQRVTRNIYRYDAPNILTEGDPAIISTMKNGNRVAVMQPRFSNSYAFLARKFDSTPSINPEKLLRA